MKKQKFLHVSTADRDESNIAVLDLGKIDINDHPKIKDKIKEIVEPKLIKALGEHFDCDVRISSIYYIDTIPLNLEADVFITMDGEESKITVFLNETWIY